jgi:hypothetical protein
MGHGSKSTWLYKLRSNPKVIKTYRYFAWRVLPTILFALCLAIVAVLWWYYPENVTTYTLLLLLAVVVRNWVFRAQYTAGRKPNGSSPFGVSDAGSIQSAQVNKPSFSR